MTENDELLKAISALEAQRRVLGDRVVDAALVPLRERLVALEGNHSTTQQRRLVTVLFADIVNSTSMSQGLEPEEVMELMDGALKRLSAPIAAYGGRVTRFMGDGFLAVFGLARVHENDARQAVRAGLAILAESRQYAGEIERRFKVPGFTTRIGVNTGWVAAGGYSEAESTIMGLTVSLAARMEQAAQAGALFITQFTYPHIRGAFDVEILPPVEVKGFTEPVIIYKVYAARPRTFRTVTRGVEGVETSLVGRETELCQLQTTFNRAINNRETQLITIIGEAGVGKSRLLYEFDRWIAQAPSHISAFKARGSHQMMTVPFGIVREMISYKLNLLTTDPADITRHKITKALSPYFAEEPEMKVHFVGSLLGFDFTGSPYLQRVQNDPQQLRERAQLYLIQYIETVASEISTVLMLDDIHWADEPSLSFITQLVHMCPKLPLTVVCLARPSLMERVPHWGQAEPVPDQASASLPIPGHLNLSLSPLTRQNSIALLDEILQNAGSLPDHLRDQLLNIADGNPFFLEEFIQSLMDIKVIHKQGHNGHWKLDPEKLVHLEIPDTLIALLQARLDSLGRAEKVLLQQAAVIGQVFWRSALQALRSDKPIPDESLALLTKRGLLYLQDSSSFAGTDEYRFHHGLLRDVAYQTLIKSERQGYHALTAAWLIEETQSSRRVGEFTPVIADHYESAGDRTSAAEWYIESGTRARNQGAPAQARNFFDHALSLLPPEISPESNEEDLRRRWRALSGRDEVLNILGDTEARVADDIALVALAELINDDSLIAEAYYRQGYYLGMSGQYAREREAYIRGLSAAERANDRKRQAMILGLKVFSEVRSGDLESAAQTATEALKSAQEVGDDEVLARNLTNVSCFYTEVGDIGRSAQLLDQQLSIIRRIGNVEGEVIGLSNLGYDYILLGMYKEAVSCLQRCIKLAQDIGHRRFFASSCLNLALAHLRGGDFLTAITELDQCIPTFQAMNYVVDQATAQTYSAMAREQLEQINEALIIFKQAAKNLEDIGTIGYAYDAKAGMARCLLALKDLDGAQPYASQLWDYLQQGKIGMEFPILGFETCADIFAATGQATTAEHIIEAGYNELMSRADKISLPDWRRSFLENVPEHMRIQLRWRRHTIT